MLFFAIALNFRYPKEKWCNFGKTITKKGKAQAKGIWSTCARTRKASENKWSLLWFSGKIFIIVDSIQRAKCLPILFRVCFFSKTKSSFFVFISIGFYRTSFVSFNKIKLIPPSRLVDFSLRNHLFFRPNAFCFYMFHFSCSFTLFIFISLLKCLRTSSLLFEQVNGRKRDRRIP